MFIVCSRYYLNCKLILLYLEIKKHVYTRGVLSIFSFSKKILNFKIFKIQTIFVLRISLPKRALIVIKPMQKKRKTNPADRKCMHDHDVCFTLQEIFYRAKMRSVLSHLPKALKSRRTYEFLNTSCVACDLYIESS